MSLRTLVSAAGEFSPGFMEATSLGFGGCKGGTGSGDLAVLQLQCRWEMTTACTHPSMSGTCRQCAVRVLYLRSETCGEPFAAPCSKQMTTACTHPSMSGRLPQADVQG